MQHLGRTTSLLLSFNLLTTVFTTDPSVQRLLRPMRVRINLRHIWDALFPAAFAYLLPWLQNEFVHHVSSSHWSLPVSLLLVSLLLVSLLLVSLLLVFTMFQVVTGLFSLCIGLFSLCIGLFSLCIGLFGGIHSITWHVCSPCLKAVTHTHTHRGQLGLDSVTWHVCRERRPGQGHRLLLSQLHLHRERRALECSHSRAARSFPFLFFLFSPVFLSYIFIASVVLLNVVIAVLLGLVPFFFPCLFLKHKTKLDPSQSILNPSEEHY